MKEEHELTVAYDGTDRTYEMMLWSVGKPKAVIMNWDKPSRFSLINEALDHCNGDYFMHLENDFYWQNPECLRDSLKALERYRDIDYIRFEHLPFTEKQYREHRKIGSTTLGVMRDDAPFRFTFNPHIRRDKFPCGRLKDKDFTKQPEQHHNDNYRGTSACLFGENFRHLGIYDEGGHFKPWYAERFTLRRGERIMGNPMKEFEKFCDNPSYRELFRRYLENNENE